MHFWFLYFIGLLQSFTPTLYTTVEKKVFNFVFCRIWKACVPVYPFLRAILQKEWFYTNIYECEAENILNIYA
jgi:hypothetical protein